MERDVNIYVGNLSPKTSEWQLRKVFGRYGKVGKISINEQPLNGDSYCFSFVEMPFDNQASVAIQKLNGEKLGGSVLTVKESELSA